MAHSIWHATYVPRRSPVDSAARERTRGKISIVACWAQWLPSCAPLDVEGGAPLYFLLSAGSRVSAPAECTIEMPDSTRFEFASEADCAEAMWALQQACALRQQLPLAVKELEAARLHHLRTPLPAHKEAITDPEPLSYGPPPCFSSHFSSASPAATIADAGAGPSTAPSRMFARTDMGVLTSYSLDAAVAAIPAAAGAVGPSTGPSDALLTLLGRLPTPHSPFKAAAAASDSSQPSAIPSLPSGPLQDIAARSETFADLLAQYQSFRDFRNAISPPPPATPPPQGAAPAQLRNPSAGLILPMIKRNVEMYLQSYGVVNLGHHLHGVPLRSRPPRVLSQPEHLDADLGRGLAMLHYTPAAGSKIRTLIQEAAGDQELSPYLMVRFPPSLMTWLALGAMGLPAGTAGAENMRLAQAQMTTGGGTAAAAAAAAAGPARQGLPPGQEAAGAGLAGHGLPLSQDTETLNWLRSRLLPAMAPPTASQRGDVLHSVCLRNQFGLACFLLWGAPVEVRESYHLRRALSASCLAGNVLMVQVLLAGGLRPDNSVLQTAVLGCDPAMVAAVTADAGKETCFSAIAAALPQARKNADTLEFVVKWAVGRGNSPHKLFLSLCQAVCKSRGGGGGLGAPPAVHVPLLQPPQDSFDWKLGGRLQPLLHYLLGLGASVAAQGFALKEACEAKDSNLVLLLLECGVDQRLLRLLAEQEAAAAAAGPSLAAAAAAGPSGAAAAGVGPRLFPQYSRYLRGMPLAGFTSGCAGARGVDAAAAAAAAAAGGGGGGGGGGMDDDGLPQDDSFLSLLAGLRPAGLPMYGQDFEEEDFEYAGLGQWGSEFCSFAKQLRKDPALVFKVLGETLLLLHKSDFTSVAHQLRQGILHSGPQAASTLLHHLLCSEAMDSLPLALSLQPDRDQLLAAACQAGNIKILEQLLLDANQPAPGSYWETAMGACQSQGPLKLGHVLAWACTAGLLLVVQEALRRGAEVDFENGLPLRQAASKALKVAPTYRRSEGGAPPAGLPLAPAQMAAHAQLQNLAAPADPANLAMDLDLDTEEEEEEEEEDEEAAGIAMFALPGLLALGGAVGGHQQQHHNQQQQQQQQHPWGHQGAHLGALIPQDLDPLTDANGRGVTVASAVHLAIAAELLDKHRAGPWHLHTAPQKQHLKDALAHAWYLEAAARLPGQEYRENWGHASGITIGDDNDGALKVGELCRRLDIQGVVEYLEVLGSSPGGGSGMGAEDWMSVDGLLSFLCSRGKWAEAQKVLRAFGEVEPGVWDWLGVLLGLATRYGHLDTMTMLLDQHVVAVRMGLAEAEAGLIVGAMLEACKHGQEAALQLLLARSECPEGVVDVQQGRLLVLACKGGHKGVVRVLLGAGVRVEVALKWAVRFGDECIVRQLRQLLARVG